MELIKSEINGYYCPDDPGEPGTDARRLSVNDIEARFIGELAHGKDVYEIGTGLGVSTKALAQKAKSVLTSDIDLWVWENVWPTLPDNVKGWDDRFPPSGDGFDMAFIDGSHVTKDVKNDIINCRLVVKDKGLIVFHDVNMETVVNAIKQSGLTVYVTGIGSIGMAWNE